MMDLTAGQVAALLEMSPGEFDFCTATRKLSAPDLFENGKPKWSAARAFAMYCQRFEAEPDLGGGQRMQARLERALKVQDD